jgi:UDP-glucose 4-epimerase
VRLSGFYYFYRLTIAAREGGSPVPVGSPAKAKKILGRKAEFNVEKMYKDAWRYVKSKI